MKRIYVYGAGSHGKVVAEAAVLRGEGEVVAFVDDAPKKLGKTLSGLPVIVSRELPPGADVAVAIGVNRFREEVTVRLRAQGFRLVTIVHPTSMISPRASIGEGTFVGPLAVLHCDARVGRGCIVNTAAVIEHDCVLGDWVHVSPGGTLGGEVTVGESTHIGLNATVLPRLQIGKGSVVGAGAVVISSLGDGITAVGVPARSIGPVKTDKG